MFCVYWVTVTTVKWLWEENTEKRQTHWRIMMSMKRSTSRSAPVESYTDVSLKFLLEGWGSLLSCFCEMRSAKSVFLADFVPLIIFPFVLFCFLSLGVSVLLYLVLFFSPDVVTDVCIGMGLSEAFTIDLRHLVGGRRWGGVWGRGNLGVREGGGLEWWSRHSFWKKTKYNIKIDLTIEAATIYRKDV